MHGGNGYEQARRLSHSGMRRLIRQVPIGLTKQVAARAARDELHERAAALAFRFFLALFPFSIFVAALAAFVASVLPVEDPAGRIVTLLGQAPTHLGDLLRDQIVEVVGTQQPGLLSFGVLGTLVVVTSGANALIAAMNRAYGVEETRPAWRRYLLAIGLSLLAGTSLVAAAVLLVAGEAFGSELAGALGVTGPYRTVTHLARWPITVLVLLLVSDFLYWAAPNVDLPWKWVTPGAVLFTAGWLLATFLFSVYVAHFGSYSVAYGTLAGAAVLMIWLYLTAYALLLGAELNAVVDERLSPREMATQRSETREEARRQRGAPREARRDTVSDLEQAGRGEGRL